MSDSALKLIDVRKAFNGVPVLHGLDLELKKGEVRGLMGENGAGKSTMMNIVGGILRMDSGRMELFDEPYAPAGPADATGNGIAFIHQELNLFTNLTIAENMFIDGFPTNFFGAIDRGKTTRITQEAIDRFALPVTPDTKVETLSAGVRQMVEISKALMKNARIMIFDEPTTSLSTREKKALFKTIGELKERGISIIYISHILEDIFLLCDRITVLRDGRITGTSPASEITENELIKQMVGRELTQIFPTVEKTTSDTVLLEASNIHWQQRVRDVSLKLHGGEIVGLYGLMGAGRTELAKVLFGVEPRDSGELLLNGRVVLDPSPGACIGEHAAFITEDRRSEGLLMTKPVDDNLILVKMPDLTNRLGVVSVEETARRNREAIRDLKIKVADPVSQLVGSLSGGNQQKVIFGKWVMKDPKIFILDEPTRGVDVGARFEIYSITMNLAKRGSAVLFISSELPELMGVCDRILVMSEGRLTGEVAKADFNQEKLLEMALPGQPLP